MKRRSLSPFAITQILMAAALAVALWLAYWPWRWGQVREEVRKRYPNIIRIDGLTLQNWMANRSAVPPLLLDVRAKAEFEAGHLPTAKRVVPGAPLAANSLLGQETKKVVVYDTVGFDAASFAADLLRQNFKDVQVLDGGIFLWANEERILDGPSGPKSKVHPGSTEYSSLLDRSKRAY